MCTYNRKKTTKPCVYAYLRIRCSSASKFDVFSRLHLHTQVSHDWSCICIYVSTYIHVKRAKHLKQNPFYRTYMHAHANSTSFKDIHTYIHTYVHTYSGGQCSSQDTVHSLRSARAQGGHSLLHLRQACQVLGALGQKLLSALHCFGHVPSARVQRQHKLSSKKNKVCFTVANFGF